MRILTRYILGEILSPRSSDARSSPSFSSCRSCPTSWRWWCATAPLSTRCGGDLPLHAAQPVQGDHSHGGAGGGAAGAEPPGRRQRDHRHARLGTGHRLLCARRLDRGHCRHAAGPGQLALSGAAGQPGDSRDGAGAGDLAGLLRDSAARLLRGFQKLRSLRAGCARRARAPPTGDRSSWPTSPIHPIP